MATPSFGLNPLDAERKRLERRRALVDLLQKQALAGPKAPTMPGAQMSPYQGLASMGEALIAALANRAQEKREKEFAGKELAQKQQEMSDFTAGIFPYANEGVMPQKPETFTPTETAPLPDFVGPPMPLAPAGMDMAKVLAMQSPVAGPQTNIAAPTSLGKVTPPAAQYGPPSLSQQQEMVARPTAPAMPMPTEQPQIAAQAPAMQTLQPAPVPAMDWMRKAVGSLSGDVSANRSLVDAQRKALSTALMSNDPRLGTFMLENIQQGNKDLQTMRRTMYEADAKSRQAELDFQRGLITEDVKYGYQKNAAEARMAFDAEQNKQNRAVTLMGQERQTETATLDRESREKIAEENRKIQKANNAVSGSLQAMGLSQQQQQKEIAAWNTLTDNYRQATQKPRLQADAYVNLKSAYGKAGAGADIPFMYNYIKFLDPNAVREGELELLKSGQSLPADLKSRISYVAPGLFDANGNVVKLDAKYKKQLFDQATNQYESTIAPALFNQIDMISTAAKKYNIDPKLIVGSDAEIYPTVPQYANLNGSKIISRDNGKTWYDEKGKRVQ